MNSTGQLWPRPLSAAAAPRRVGGGRAFAIEDAHDLIEPCREAPVKVALPESGCDDPPR
jgi:hypothetical protein